jgi:outer membrane immunogenic protein
MKKLLLTGVAFGALIAGPAMAADLGTPVYRRPLVAVYNWTGFYVGGSAAGIWNDRNTTIAVGGSPGGISTPTQRAIATSLSLQSSSWIAGGGGGYNWQTGQWVYGLEADISATGLDPTPSVTNQAVFGAPLKLVTTSGEAKLDWLGTVRARLGFLIYPQLLLYGTGGLAFGHHSETLGVASSGNFAAADQFNLAVTNSGTSTGWVAGAGVEHLLAPNWSIKAEWLYYDLGSHTLPPIVRSPNNIPPPGFSALASTPVAGNIVRVGVNYKFGYIPVVTR